MKSRVSKIAGITLPSNEEQQENITSAYLLEGRHVFFNHPTVKMIFRELATRSPVPLERGMGRWQATHNGFWFAGAFISL